MYALRKNFNSFRLVPYVFVLMLFVSTGFAQITWRRTYGGTSLDRGYCIDQTVDGGYIVVGDSWSFGNGAQVYLVKTDSLGDTLWTRTYGGAANDCGIYVRQTIDGGYILVGYTNSFGDSVQIYLIKTDSLGDTLWTRTYGGPGNEVGYCVKQTMDGGYIITGGGRFLWSFDPVYLIKTDSIGNMEWSKVYGDTIYSTGTAVQQTADGGYIITGCCGFYNGLFLIKTDSLGDTIWTKNYSYQFPIFRTFYFKIFV